MPMELSENSYFDIYPGGSLQPLPEIEAYNSSNMVGDNFRLVCSTTVAKGTVVQIKWQYSSGEVIHSGWLIFSHNYFVHFDNSQ